MSDGNLTFQVQSTVRVQESGHLVNPGKHSREELQATIRACLRELDEEREAVGFAAEKVKWALDGEKMVRPDERDEGRVEKLEELLDALRSLLPETEGEA